MDAADRAEFEQLLALMAEVFSEPLTAARVAGYWIALADLSFGEVQLAIWAAMRECYYFPRPALLRENAGVGVPDAGLVNALISQHVGTIGGDRTAPQDLFVALCVQRLGGIWRASDMSAVDRLRALKAILPGVVAAARARGVPMPHERDLTDRHARRLLVEARLEGDA